MTTAGVHNWSREEIGERIQGRDVEERGSIAPLSYAAGGSHLAKAKPPSDSMFQALSKSPRVPNFFAFIFANEENAFAADFCLSQAGLDGSFTVEFCFIPGRHCCPFLQRFLSISQLILCSDRRSPSRSRLITFAPMGPAIEIVPSASILNCVPRLDVGSLLLPPA